MKLLIVEDDKPTLQTYEDNIESFNKKSDVKIEYTIKENLDEAKNSLLSPDFDGAIIDLKLSASTTELEGLEIVEEIENNQRFPIYIVSGSIAQIEKEESAFLKKRNRDTNFKEILSEIVEIYKTGITNILGKKGKIDNYLNNIFWNHLSNSLDLWTDDKKRSPEEKQKSLLRYTLLHLQEYLDINSSGDLEKYHPAEFLITKPIKPNIFTGDVLETKQNKRCIVLTPACDIDLKNGKRKADKILTINIINPSDIDPEFSNPKMSGGKKSKISQILNNSNPRYHCIPSSKDFSIGIIDFQDKQTTDSGSLDKAIVDSRTERIATISHPFLKDIIARYSNYYSRQGSPDFDSDEVFESLFD